MEGRYQFVSPEWDEVSDEAKDLVREGQGGLRLHPKACWEAWLVHPGPLLYVDPKAVGGGSHKAADSRGGHVSPLALFC